MSIKKSLFVRLSLWNMQPRSSSAMNKASWRKNLTRGKTEPTRPFWTAKQTQAYAFRSNMQELILKRYGGAVDLVGWCGFRQICFGDIFGDNFWGWSHYYTLHHDSPTTLWSKPQKTTKTKTTPIMTNNHHNQNLTHKYPPTKTRPTGNKPTRNRTEKPDQEKYKYQ